MTKENKKPVVNKQWVIIVSVAILVLGGLALFKGLVLNKPDQTPREITESIVEYIQTKDPSDEQTEEYKKYFTEDAQKELSELADEEEGSTEDSGDMPVITIKDVQENDDTATSTIEIDVLIVKVPVQFKFVKEGNYLAGYSWKINDIIGISESDSDSSKSESTVNPGDEASIGEDWKIKVSKPVDYVSTDEWEQPDDGNKYIAVELEYFNNSDKSDTVNPMNLTLRDSEGHSYDMSWMAAKKPDFGSDDTVTAGGSLKGWVTFEVPTNATITSAVYANSYSTVTVNY